MKVILYCDGGCRGNGAENAIGAWAYSLQFGEHYKEDSKGYTHDTEPTNNRMELLALINGLEAIKTTKYEVEIRQDSKYVLQGAESWIHKWKLNNWRTATKKPVKNGDLWKRLDIQLERFKGSLLFTHVYGHTGEEGNSKVDLLCNLRMDEIS